MDMQKSVCKFSSKIQRPDFLHILKILFDSDSRIKYSVYDVNDDIDNDEHHSY